MKKPNISQNFTLTDIRKIKNYKSKVMKDMTLEQQIEYIKIGANKFKKELQQYKKTKTANTITKIGRNAPTTTPNAAPHTPQG